MSTRSDRQRSINDRIRLEAAAQGVDANRVRRHLVFQRLLARLGSHGFVLKGGYCLEVRLPHAARATKDVDLVTADHLAADSDTLADALESALDAGIDDGFAFRIGRLVPLRDAGTPHRAWRVELMAILDGADFERIKLDVVGQAREVAGATEPLTVPSPVSEPGLGDVVVQAVDVYQHAAEKLHAYARLYAHDRPSSRVKDLVDLVLLIEAGLLDDVDRLRRRLQIVYAERDGTAPTPSLPVPPGNWAAPYAAVAAELDLLAASTEAAYQLVVARYAATLNEGTSG